MKNISFKMSKLLAAVALIVTTLNVNSTCMCYAYQPKLPKNARRLRKF